jgi:hypothetical protein
MGVFTYAADQSAQIADEMCGPAGKIQDEHSGASVDTRESTKSPNSGPAQEPDEFEEEFDDGALALMGPPALNRITTDEHSYFPSRAPMDAAYGMQNMVRDGQNGVSLDSLGQQVAPMEMPSNMPMPSMQQNNLPEVDMANSMPAPVSPNNNAMMYSDFMMQQAMQQAMQQQGQMQSWQHGGIQYVPVPTPVPVQMMPQMSRRWFLTRCR